jgi:hypothetical protein
MHEDGVSRIYSTICVCLGVRWEVKCMCMGMNCATASRSANTKCICMRKVQQVIQHSVHVRAGQGVHECLHEIHVPAVWAIKNAGGWVSMSAGKR